MLAMLVITTLVSVIIEIILVSKLKLMPWFVKYPSLDLIFSILLSYLMSLVFGISGLIMVTATLLSSVITFCIYGFYRVSHRIKAIKGQPNWLKTSQVIAILNEYKAYPQGYAVYPITREQAIINIERLLNNPTK